MKIMTRTKIYLPIAAMVLISGLANPAAAQTSCKGFAPGCFKGIFQGQDGHDSALPPGSSTVLIRTTANGIGTHLNQSLLVREITGDLVNSTDKGSAQWIAGNRKDSISTTIDGKAELDVAGGVLKVTETHTVTGGTGRFAGAQGSLTVELVHTLAPSGIAGGFETHDISGSFEGTITVPGAAH